MTIKPKAARTLRDVRERLRDAAAANHAVAAATAETAAGELAAEQDRLVASVTGAAAALARARSVTELDRVRIDVDLHRDAATAAATRHHDALAVSTATSQALREKARQLRTAERILELVDKARFDAEERRERTANDDLAGRRR